MHDIVLPKSRLKRIKNSYRYPGQAAVVARMPLLGRRVPMRGMWRREPLRLALRAERAMTSRAGGPSLLAGICGGWGGTRTMDAARGAVTQTAPVVREVAGRARLAGMRAVQDGLPRVRKLGERVRGVTRDTREAARRGVHIPVSMPHEALAGRGSAPMARLADVRARRKLRLPRPAGTSRIPQLGTLAAGIAIGALAAYYFDAQQGRRRRALVRDKLAHVRNVLTRDVPERTSRRARFFGGVAKGVRHNAMALMRPEDGRVEDDETLVARVRSEVLRDPRYKPGEIHIDAYEGCVTLRGQLDNPRDIQRLVSATRDVDGVREVRSYLHLPDALPPNKADVYRASEAHLPAM